MSLNGSYVFERLEGRHEEAAMLAERAQLRLDGFSGLLDRHGFPETGRVLDVGCGQGIRTRIMAEKSPGAQVMGVDRSPELLASARELAREKGETPNLSFREEDLYDLTFPDQSFDFIYARLVFMHLSDPLAALRGLRRILRPEGRILIEDADRDCMFFEPAPPSFASFWKKVQDGQRRHGGDPNVGRRLGPYLKELGFSDLRIETQAILGGGSEIEFLVRTLMPSLNTYLEPVDRPEGLAAIQDLGRLAEDPRACFYHFWFVVSGRG